MTAVIAVVKITVEMMKIVVMMIVPTQATTAASLKSIWENILHALQIFPQMTAF